VEAFFGIVSVKGDASYQLASQYYTSNTFRSTSSVKLLREEEVTREFSVGPNSKVDFYRLVFSAPGLFIESDAIVQVPGGTLPTVIPEVTIEITMPPQIVDDNSPLPEGTYAIRTTHNTLLRGHPGGEGSPVDLQVDKHDWGCMPWEHWILVKAQNGRYGIRSAHGTYLRAHPGGVGAKVDLQVDKHNWNAMPWEQFVIVPAEGGRFGIRSIHGTYLRAHPGGEGAKIDLQIDSHNWGAMPWEQYVFQKLA